jgi:uncharacterized protein
VSTPIFGIQFIMVDEVGNPVIGADLSTIGLIGPAPTADPETFPENTPVKVYSNDTATLALLGLDGYLPDAVNGINDQLGDLEMAAQMVIVVTPPGTDPDPAIAAQQTIGHIMGDSIQGTGLWAFLKSPDLLACTPRVICVPGYTGQLATSLDTLVSDTMGSGYLPGVTYPVTFAGGGDPDIVVPATAHAVANPAGQIGPADLVIDTYGAWFTAAPTATLPAPPVAVHALMTAVLDPLGSGTVTSLLIGVAGGGYVPGETYPLTFTPNAADSTAVAPTGHATADSTGAITQASLFIDSPGSAMTIAPTVTTVAPAIAVTALISATVAPGANPICATLTPVLDQLLGMAIVEPDGTNEQGDEAWRSTLDSERLIAVTGGCKILDPVSSEIIVTSLAPRIAGLLIARDQATGAPFHSAANQPVQGIVGPARVIAFSLVDGANEGQQLLSNNIGILVQGETGSDFAISSGGFIFVGTDNLGSDPLWQFYNVKRGRDYIHLSLLKALRYYLGRSNITGQTVQAIINTMNGFLADLQANDNILGYRVNFNGSYNSADEIRLGNLTVGFAAEEPPVLRLITVRSARYRAAIDAMVASLEQQLNIAA